MELDPDRVLSSPFAIGGLGALVALKFAPGATWWQRFTNVLCGSLVAGFGSPALIEWLRFTSDGVKGWAAFMIGVLGMSLISAVLKGIGDLKVAELITGLFPKR